MTKIIVLRYYSWCVKQKAKFIYVIYKDCRVSSGKYKTFMLPMFTGAYSCNKFLDEAIEIAKNGQIAKRSEETKRRTKQRNCDRNFNEYLEIHAQFKYSLLLYYVINSTIIEHAMQVKI